jgi:energy-converting hydrogenase Eha subunit A
MVIDAPRNIGFGHVLEALPSLPDEKMPRRVSWRASAIRRK